MRKLVYYVAVSLDGRIAAPDGSFDAFPTEGDHMAALIRDWSDTIPGHVRDALGLPPPNGCRFDSVIMGWNTYAIGLAEGIDSPYPHLRQFVVSARRPVLPDAIELISDDPISAIRLLKSEPGDRDIWLCGGGRLAATIASEIDQLVVKVNPILLGDGVPLFDGSYQPLSFELASSTRYDSGVLVNEYERKHSAG